MGQVLGFSQCQEYGSVASTPDSTPPCTDGGNEESELYELQTAREWSEDDEGADEDPDDEDGLASSSSLWGTPRQNSYELTFSYFAIAEAEAVGASRHLRERRRGSSTRTSRTPLYRTDTLETLLDSPDVEWDPQAFLTQEEQEEQEEAAQRREQVGGQTRTNTEWIGLERELHEQTEATQAPQYPETQETDTGVQREETLSTPNTEGLESDVQPSTHALFTPQHSYSQTLQATSSSLSPEPASPVSISVKLLTSLTADPTSSSTAASGLNSQEQLVSEHWFSALNLSEDVTVWTHIHRAMDLIYWKDTERTGMVLTGLVVGLLSLFQLSIISVLATISLAVMCFTISVRLYYQVLYILNWGDGVHPFKSYLDMDISLSGELVDRCTQKVIVMTLSVVDALKRLFFVGSVYNSLKFLFLIYLVTFLGKLFNGLTLLIISVIALFSLPLFYQRHQEQVDSVVAKVLGQYDNIMDILVRLAHGGGPPPNQTPGGAKPKAQ